MPTPNFPDQKSFTAAVDRFSKQHDDHAIDPRLKIYRDLIPKTSPQSDEQYAFEVDLDKCTGCKACVSACHNQNGLEEDETWRSVGLLQGGTSESSVLQHVTSACHHCLDPACMSGCPTKAYVKDDTTGIVKHLDDQCFGCQYCILKCPYDVPKYNKKKGIVHKCDMCIGRLNEGDAPACVSACPTGAIRITLVKRQEVRKNFVEFVNIPEAPASDYTFPTTRYKTNRVWPSNTVSIDYLHVKPEHSHLPLVIMLVLTQLSVGTFLAELVLKIFFVPEITSLLSPLHRWIALGTGIVALMASIFHLGRPQYAFRAVLGLRTSWLSREILAFGAFATFAVIYVLLSGINEFINNFEHFWGASRVLNALCAVVFLTGLSGVLCSSKVYRDTHRPFWDQYSTTFKFLLTMIVLGFSLSALIASIYIAMQSSELTAAVMRDLGYRFCVLILGASVVKMLLEAGIFYFLRKDDCDSLKKTAILMSRPLRKFTNARFICGVLGGIVFPVAMMLLIKLDDPLIGAKAIGFLSFTFIFLLAGEFLERYLFFRAVVPLKMPGGKLN